MTDFTQWFAAQERGLVKILEGISGDTGFQVTLSRQSTRRPENISPYVLPVDVHEGRVVALVAVGDHAEEVPIGFTSKLKMWDRGYYSFDVQTNGTLRINPTNKPRDNVLYIPLETSPFQSTTGGVVSPRFQIKGSPQEKPLYLVTEGDGILETYGIVRAGSTFALTDQERLSEGQERGLHEYITRVRRGRLREALLLTDTKRGSGLVRGISWDSPREIVGYLDTILVGQAEAKKAAAIAFSNYLIRRRTGNRDIKKEMVLLIGPTGSGKTMLFQTLCEASGLPFVVNSLAGKSSEGYVGFNASSLFNELVSGTEEAPYGVVFLDEIDKIANNGRDFFEPRLQREVMNWMSGARLRVTLDEERKKERFLHTGNMLFVGAGTFEDQGSGSLETFVSQRLTRERARNRPERSLDALDAKDLISYGFIGELVSRMSTRVVLPRLTPTQMEQILRQEESSPLRGYRALLGERGYSLDVAEDVFALVVSACSPDTGARALDTVCSELFREVLYDPRAFSTAGKITIDRERARELLEGKNTSTATVIGIGSGTPHLTVVEAEEEK